MKVYKVTTSSISYTNESCIVTAKSMSEALDRAKAKADADGADFDFIHIELLYDTDQEDYVSGWTDGSGFSQVPDSYESKSIDKISWEN